MKQNESSKNTLLNWPKLPWYMMQMHTHQSYWLKRNKSHRLLLVHIVDLLLVRANEFVALNRKHIRSIWRKQQDERTKIEREKNNNQRRSQWICMSDWLLLIKKFHLIRRFRELRSFSYPMPSKARVNRMRTTRLDYE